jgi:hypothetical protein
MIKLFAQQPVLRKLFDRVWSPLVIRHAKRMRHTYIAMLYHIFPHYRINGTIFGKELLNIKCVF